ncbi:flavin reductase family protein [Shewanella glacialimarina]|uniref:flavin reductase family protein n=1 Tax=Shewanella glacialimarina TaxID=2590884 RepID=UPI001CF820F8|nr:flavin reductase [Shewanella glacialimarina]UCX05855.1 flavin oxidoreductase [Shewanella glacialimarina]
MKHLTSEDIIALEPRFRARFINSLSGFKSANLVGTQDAKGITNLSMISSAFHIGADPALMGMIIRPDGVPRDTLDNIKQTGVYTINQVSAQIYKQAHQTSARYDVGVSEFEQVGLTAEYINDVAAPFVAQSRLKFSLQVREIIPLAINNTILVIGEISHVLFVEQALKADGYLDIESLETVAVSGLNGYHTTKRLSRLSYAKPDQDLSQLSVDGD